MTRTTLETGEPPQTWDGTSLPAVAWLPVGVIAAAVAALLTATSGRYGYHRDELYFRVLGEHPAWGYIDQPPGTPVLIHLSIALFGDSVWGLRVPATLCAAASAFLLALLAREVGGGRAAQVIAALAACGTFVLLFGHIFITATLDLVVWLTVILFAMRALLRDQPRWWLAVGVSVGIGLYNKDLVLLLLLALGAGLLLVGPRRALASRWLWAGMALAVAIGSPNLLYQLGHHFPELTMAAALRRHKGADSTALLLPFQLVAVGLPLAPVTVAGVVRLLRDRSLRPVRAFAVGYFVLLAVFLLLAGQPYYTLGLVLALHAVGSVATADWLVHRPVRRTLLGAGVLVNVAAAVAFALPVFPLTAQQSLGIAAANQGTRDQIGWPTYVSQIAAVFRALPAGQAAHAVIITGNYGEYGAIARYGGADGLPLDRIYSGQNELRNLGTPPDSARLAVVVGIDDGQWLASWFASCTVAGHLDSGYRIDNEEQHRAVEICRDPRQPWATLWPHFYHYD